MLQATWITPAESREGASRELGSSLAAVPQIGNVALDAPDVLERAVQAYADAMNQVFLDDSGRVLAARRSAEAIKPTVTEIITR